MCKRVCLGIDHVVHFGFAHNEHLADEAKGATR